MTELSDKVVSRVLAGLDRLGAAGSIVKHNDTYSAGGVTGTSTTVAATLVGPLDESQRYAASGADTRVTATFYVCDDGLTIVPSNGDHVVFDGVTYAVVTTWPMKLQAVTVAYQLDVGAIDG